ncbi:hypothetical protein FGO68_gene15250 [Halteria grandinella]|uniref:Uncharacterized protein n=1 Tax=Halteria grandinella TaxID=5974 RepID=A0A8J8NZ65_HALGN|nr:hypothetical protein FGO68_gene15250 [Halteria grandinella]
MHIKQIESSRRLSVPKRHPEKQQNTMGYPKLNMINLIHDMKNKSSSRNTVKIDALPPLRTEQILAKQDPKLKKRVSCINPNSRLLQKSPPKINKDGTSIHYENIKNTVRNLGKHLDGRRNSSTESDDNESARVYGLQQPRPRKSERFVKPLLNGKIIAGGKALSINDFLTTRNNRGLKTEGSGEEPEFRKSVTYQEEIAPQTEEVKQVPKVVEKPITLLIDPSEKDVSDFGGKSEFNHGEEETPIIQDLDWTNSKLFRQLKSGEDINQELNDDAHSIIDTPKSHHPRLPTSLIKIYSSIESNYFSTLLKCKLDRKDQLQDDYRDTSLKALKTLKALMYLLLLRPQWQRVKQRYYTFNNEKLSEARTCLKLLLRVKQMYEARTLIVKILRLAIKRDQLIAKNKSPQHSDQPLKSPAHQLSSIAARILSLIDILQTEHRVFRRPFIMEGMDYVERLKQEYEELSRQFNEQFSVEYESQK